MNALRHVAVRDLKSWFGHGFAKGSSILTEGCQTYHFLDEAGFKHEPHKMPGGWRSAKHLAFPE